MTLYDRYLTSSMNPMGALGEIRVTIIGVNPDTGRLMVRDSLANEFEVDGSNRAKGVGLPQTGEQWTIAKSAGAWYLKSQVASSAIPIVTGSRSGLHPVLTQMLDAMAQQGMLIDETTPAPIDADLPDPLPGIGDPDYVDPTIGDDPIGDEEDEGGVYDDYTGPAPTNDPGPPLKPGKGAYSKTWVPLYAGTFNTFKDLGPRTAYQDLVKLVTKTRLQIVGLQEAHGNDRDSKFNQLQDLGWSHYRPKISAFSDEDTIIWRTDLFTLLDQGVVSLSTVDIAGMPPRYLAWVKVLFKPANRVLYFMSTHVDPHLDVVPYTRKHVGKPNFEQYRERVEQSIVHFGKMADKIQEFGRNGPVILAGDFNINALADHKVRYKGFPAAKFGAVGATSNWAEINHDAHGPTHPGQIDQIWLARGKDWFVKFVDHWGFAGFKSDHRPLMTQFSIRGKD